MGGLACGPKYISPEKPCISMLGYLRGSILMRRSVSIDAACSFAHHLSHLTPIADLFVSNTSIYMRPHTYVGECSRMPWLFSTSQVSDIVSCTEEVLQITKRLGSTASHRRSTSRSLGCIFQSLSALQTDSGQR